ncbi:MAG TPA: DUF3426 domain-containing protein [Gammaproteobacteria bacterium]|nr:DUF3426 domain-containing protein [Gammaproteobacteria bacterium]
MEIECPQCGTRYRVDDARLQPQGTRVRCSTCGHRFLAYPRLRPEEHGDLELGRDLAPGPRSPAAEAPAPEAGGKGRTGRESRKERRRQRPVRQAGSSRRAGSWLMALLVLLLMAGLALEVGYAFRARLLAQPWVRTAVEEGLRLAGVSWQLPVALRHYRVRGVQVRRVTLASGRRVTLLEGRLINRASFAQRRPQLEVRARGPGDEIRFRQVADPGTRFPTADAMTLDELGRRWREARATFPETLRPGQAVPFLVVLADVPPGVRRFQVELVD